MNPKGTARREVLRHRGRLHPDWIGRASARIREQVLARPEWAAAASVALYLSLPGEVQTAELVAAAHAAGKRVCVPAWRADEDGYAFAWLRPGAAMRRGRMGIAEPVAPEWAAPGEIGLVLVPLVAFDRHGRRLGHGGGHFDRLLARCAAPRVGLAFEVQRLTAVPVEPHDVPLDLVVTEKGADGPGAARA